MQQKSLSKGKGITLQPLSVARCVAEAHAKLWENLQSTPLAVGKYQPRF